MYAVSGNPICAGVCVYPDTLSQSFIYPEALDAEGVLGRCIHIGPGYCLSLPPSLTPTPSSLTPPAMV